MIERRGLNLAERRQLATAIRDRINDGAEVIHALYQPGDATHYDLVFARLGRSPFVGATYDRHEEYGPLRPALGVKTSELLLGSWWVLSWPGYPAMVVDLSAGSFTHPSYVAEKMKVGGHSAAVIAELLSMIAGVDEPILASMRQDCAAVFSTVDDVPQSPGHPVERATSIGDGQLRELQGLQSDAALRVPGGYAALVDALKTMLAGYGYPTDGSWGVDYQTGAIIERPAGDPS